MAAVELVYKKSELAIQRAIVEPRFGDPKVLTSDRWTYVDLWLRRNAKGSDASFFWEQGRQFYIAAQALPIIASPLLLYYYFLNCTKALLAAKGHQSNPQHGVSGTGRAGRTSLSNEIVYFKTRGVLPALCRYYGEDPGPADYTLKSLLYNLAFVHRAYTLTYAEPELFLSIDRPYYVRKNKSSEAWLCFEAEEKYDDERILATLPRRFERDAGYEECQLRSTRRFRWVAKRGRETQNISNLKSYHQKDRFHLQYIAGFDTWYLKRRISGAAMVDRHSTVIMFAAMHRLSELSRYNPLRLSKILDTHRNWLVAEFIQSAPLQFLDEISCEITGQDIQTAGVRTAGLG